MKKQKISTAKTSAWKWFSIYIRLKYSDNGICTCVSCEKRGYWKGDGFQAGHMIAKGKGNGIYFLEEVVRPQCSECNGPRGGMPEKTIPILIDWYGQDGLDEFIRMKMAPLKLSVFELKEMEKEYKQKAMEIAERIGVTL
jgi:hypothetical protein